MKIIVQIPIYNERETLAQTLADIPRFVPGIGRVEVLVIDDGSTDGSHEIALANGADHLLRLPANQGLAKAFLAGIHRCLDLGADIIVNTDGDNQYFGFDILRLVEPVLGGRADIVVGERPIEQIAQFSWLKKRLQRLGSRVVSWASGVRIPDATSGFRAFNRSAALKLNVFGYYTYTLETLIQAGLSGMRIGSVPIRTNPVHRPSRLIHSLPAYLAHSAITIVRSFMIYRPVPFFGGIGLVFISIGLVLGLRFVFAFAQGHGQGKVQSLILVSTLIVTGMGSIAMALVTDLISVNRRLLETLDLRLRSVEASRSTKSSGAARERGKGNFNSSERPRLPV